MMNTKLPKLMCDASNKDGHAEPMMDYIISWCLRCAVQECKQEKPILHKQCKSILCKLLNFTRNQSQNITFTKIDTWKQESKIDLWVELELKNNNTTEYHSILIENKYYGKLRKYQLEKKLYKHDFDSYYDCQKQNYIRHYVLITCIERNDPKFASYYGEVTDWGFLIMTFKELRGDCTETTESDIYNEFWLRW